MSDRLNEAIEWVHEVRVTSTHLGPHTKEQMRVVEVAARAYADLVNGERVAWCETHGYGHIEIPKRPELCRIVPKLLIDPPKEEE